jgi:U4/U6.U5 tri-snRNP-associated protein 3
MSSNPKLNSGRHMHRHDDDDQDDDDDARRFYYNSNRNNHAPSRRKRSRSRSKSPEQEDAMQNRFGSRKEETFEQERRARMARLRAQNEEEEQRLAIMDRDQVAQREAQQRAKKAKEEILIVDAKELEGLDEDEQMHRLLGFTGFSSTKGAEVEDNKTTAANGAAAKNKARKYRQYMNRKGGFNRPLDKMD